MCQKRQSSFSCSVHCRFMTHGDFGVHLEFTLREWHCDVCSPHVHTETERACGTVCLDNSYQIRRPVD